MKKMKKFGILAGTALLAAGSLAACSGSDSAEGAQCVGVWTPESIEAEGEVMTVEEMAAMGVDMADLFKFDLKEDGKLDATVLDESVEGTWEDAEGGCAITFEGETKVLPIEDGMLVSQDEGSGAKLLLSRDSNEDK